MTSCFDNETSAKASGPTNLNDFTAEIFWGSGFTRGEHGTIGCLNKNTSVCMCVRVCVRVCVFLFSESLYKFN